MSIRRRKWRDSKGAIHEAWFVDVQAIGKDGRLRRLQRTSPLQTRRAAEKLEHELREELLNADERNAVVAIETPTFSVFAERFMTTYAMTNNKPSEVETKRMLLRVHLVPDLGTLALDRINPAAIESYKAKKLRAGLLARPSTIISRYCARYCPRPRNGDCSRLCRRSSG